MINEVECSLKAKLEYPYDGMVVGGKRLLVGGYAFLKNGDDVNIRIYIDGEFATLAKWGTARFDIFNEYKSEVSYESGFFVNLMVNRLSEGQHTLDVKTQIADEKEERLSSVQINVQKAEGAIKSKQPNYKYHYLENTFIPAGAGYGSVRKSGAREFKGFMQMVDISEDAKILEVGCGMGRFSLHLAKHVQGKGSYTGLELLPSAVKYLNQNFVPRFDNFRVDLADVQNDLYNPNCKYTASNYVFPYDDNTFDFVFLQSVFTHLVKDDLENYLRQIHRVLKVGGQCLITYFIIDDQSEELICAGKAHRSFKFQQDGFRSDTEKKIEIAIAYNDSYLRKFYNRIGLKIIEPIHSGSWRGIKGKSGQDAIVATKK